MRYRGLSLAAASTVFIIGYVVFAVGVLIATCMVLLTVWCCIRRPRLEKVDEDGHQLATIYDHGH